MIARLYKQKSVYRIQVSSEIIRQVKFPDKPVMLDAHYYTIKCTLLNMAILHENKVKFTKELGDRKRHLQDLARYDAHLPNYLFPFQDTSVRQLISQKGVLLADEQGLGKTVQIITALLIRNEAPALIICPAHLKFNWLNEFKKFAPELSVEILSGRNPYPCNGDYLIINYEILPYWVQEFKGNLRAIVCDEAHRIKSRKAKCTKAVISLGKRPIKIFATGTPLVNNPENVWGLVDMINPNILGGYTEFVDYFTTSVTKTILSKKGEPLVKYYGGKKVEVKRTQITGVRNLHILHKTLRSSCMIRRRKTDVLPDLPNKLFTAISVEVKASIRREAKNATQAILTALNSMEEQAAFSKVYRELGMAKTKPAIEWVSDFLETSDDPLVVAVWHRDVANVLYDKFKDVSVQIIGGVTDKEQRITTFKEGGKRLLIGNIKTIGTGLTLTNASTMLFVELPLTAADLLQVQDRIHRIGQTHQCNYYYLVAQGTLEDGIIRLLDNKTLMANSVVDGGVDSITTMDSILRQAARGMV